MSIDYDLLENRYKIKENKLNEIIKKIAENNNEFI